MNKPTLLDYTLSCFRLARLSMIKELTTCIHDLIDMMGKQRELIEEQQALIKRQHGLLQLKKGREQVHEMRYNDKGIYWKNIN